LEFGGILINTTSVLSPFSSNPELTAASKFLGAGRFLLSSLAALFSRVPSETYIYPILNF